MRFLDQLIRRNGHAQVIPSIATEAIRARRNTLAAQIDQAKAQYEQMEQAIRELDRQLCAMHGGLQELDALLAELDARGLCAAERIEK